MLSGRLLVCKKKKFFKPKASQASGKMKAKDKMKDAAELHDAVCNFVNRVRQRVHLDHYGSKLAKEWEGIIRAEKEDPESIRQKRIEAIALFKKIKEETEEANKKLIEERAPEHLKKVLQTTKTRNVLAMKKLGELAGHCDTDLWRSVLDGFQTVGTYPKTGLWGENPRQEEVKELEGFYAAAVKVREQAPKGFPVEALQEIITNIEEDVKLGRYEEITVEQLKVPPAYAFPKIEPEKVRTIIDERWKNEFSKMTEKVRLHGTRTVMEIIKAYMAPTGMEELGKRFPASQFTSDVNEQIGEELTSFRDKGTTKTAEKVDATERLRAAAVAANKERTPGARGGRRPHLVIRDWSKAYYQVGVKSPEENPVGAWDAMKQRYRLFTAAILNMGNKFSVSSWCRVAELCMRIMAMLAHTVTPIYIDDAIITALEEGNQEAYEAYEQLCDTLGLELSDKPAARQNSRDTGRVKVLGLRYDWDQNTQAIMITVPEDKRTQVALHAQELREQAAKDNIQRKTIQKLLGMANFVTVSAANRAGNEVMRSLYAWTQEETFNEMIKSRWKRRSLLRTAEAIANMVHKVNTVTLEVGKIVRPMVFLYTDASTDGGPNNEPGIGFTLITETGEIVTGSHFLRCSDYGDARIETLEALAVAFAARMTREYIGGREVLVLIDNTPVLYNFIKCSGKNAAVARLATEVVNLWFESETKPYYAYVKSEWNLADHMTRLQKRALFDRRIRSRRLECDQAIRSWLGSAAAGGHQTTTASAAAGRPHQLRAVPSVGRDSTKKGERGNYRASDAETGEWPDAKKRKVSATPGTQPLSTRGGQDSRVASQGRWRR